MNVKQLFCRHHWKTRNVLIHAPDIRIKEENSIKNNWLQETKEYMRSIGLEDVFPFFFRECEKCGKQTKPGIDTLVKATILDYYIPEYEWAADDFQHVENKYPREAIGDWK